MSSHHFVKEGQEPPLIVLDWNEKLEVIAKQLLAWQPTIWVHTSCLEAFVQSGLKPDGIIGKEDIDCSYLEPLLKISEDDQYELFNASTLLVNLSLEEMSNWVSNYGLTIYSDYFKLYLYRKKEFEKWIPEAKKIYFFERGLKLIPVDYASKACYSFKSPAIIVEEV